MGGIAGMPTARRGGRKNICRGDVSPGPLRRGGIETDTSTNEVNNWSKAGGRFAPLNPGTVLAEEAEDQVVSRCSSTVTTIVSLCYAPPAPIAVIERSHRFPNDVLRSLPGSYITSRLASRNFSHVSEFTR